MDKLLISFSGGRTSAYMMIWCLLYLEDKYEMIVVFANTGKEDEKTLEFVQKCADYFKINIIWLEAEVHYTKRVGTTYKIVDFNTASRNGEPYEAVIKKYGIPNVAYLHCTRELKTQPIKAYCRSIGWKKYYTAIGIRIDEIDRINPYAKKFRLIYPLISFTQKRKTDILEFWKSQPFDLNLQEHQGNCDLCFKKSFKKLMMVVNESPQKAEWWNKIEEKYQNFIPEGRTKNNPPIHFFRGNKSTKELIAMAKGQVKDMPNIELSNGCVESCEVF